MQQVIYFTDVFLLQRRVLPVIINGLMTGNSFKRTRFDLWLAGLCLSRVCTCFIFMTYPGALSVLREEWGMSGVQAGAVATAFQVGYAVSLVVFSAAVDRVGSKRLYLCSMFVSGSPHLALPSSPAILHPAWSSIRS